MRSNNSIHESLILRATGLFRIDRYLAVIGEVHLKAYPVQAESILDSKLYDCLYEHHECSEDCGCRGRQKYTVGSTTLLIWNIERLSVGPG